MILVMNVKEQTVSIYVVSFPSEYIFSMEIVLGCECIKFLVISRNTVIDMYNFATESTPSQLQFPFQHYWPYLHPPLLHNTSYSL